MKEKLKTALGIAWKAGVGLLGLAASVVGLLMVNLWHERTYGRDCWDDRTLTPDVVVEAYHDDTYRVRNVKTGKYTTPRLKWVSGVPERDTLTVFCTKEGYRGYLSVNTGRIVIPAQYRKAWHFSEGLGAVLGENGRIGFIDPENRLVIGYTIPYEKGYFDYVFKDGYCIVKVWNGRFFSGTAYGKDGRQVLDWGYSVIGEPNEKGYRIVSNEEGSWLYDKDFRLVFPDRYDAISFASGNEGIYVTLDHVKQLLNDDGKVLEPFVIDHTYRLQYATRFHDSDEERYEMVPDVAVYRVDSWEGLLDTRTGKAITPAKYWSFRMASKDIVVASLGYDEESVLMGLDGHIIRQ